MDARSSFRLEGYWSSANHRKSKQIAERRIWKQGRLPVAAAMAGLSKTKQHPHRWCCREQRWITGGTGDASRKLQRAKGLRYSEELTT